MPLVTSLNNDDLDVMYNIWRALFNMAKAKMDQGLMKIAKSILNALRQETELRKIKSATGRNVREEMNLPSINIPSPQELGLMKRKVDRLRLIEKAMTTETAEELYALTQETLAHDPNWLRGQAEKQRRFDEDFEKMLADGVLRAGDRGAQTAAFSHLAKYLSNKYGSRAAQKAKQLLEAEQ